MRKENITKKAFRLYSSYNPKYFPCKFLQIVFDNIAPYFTLWMSSEIVTALSGSGPERYVYLLIGITLSGNLAVRVLCAVLKRSAETRLKVLENNEAAAFNTKTLSLDYDKLENPEIRQHRRRITENSYINYYGVIRMRLIAEGTFEAATNVVFSLALFAEMILKIGRAGLNLAGIGLFAALIAAVAVNFAARNAKSGKLAAQNKVIGDHMLEENKLGQGFQLSGMDNRIYRQQLLYDGINRQMIKAHRQVFGHLADMEFGTSVPVILTERLSELCSYLIICLYCTLGAFPVGSVIKYVGYLSRMTTNIGMLLLTGRESRDNERFLSVYLDYFDIRNDMYQGSLAVEKRSDKQFEIEFKDVSFRYQGAGDYALRHINLKLKVGERLAVVGMNGSGKTTMIKLLCRLYDPQEGEILLNGVDIRKFRQEEYIRLFSVVFQDFKLLSLPLGENVAASTKVDRKLAIETLGQAGLKERLEKLPGGLDTYLYQDIADDGVEISGGEAQKIAIARALYKDAPFVLLDEPTASLDPLSEYEIYSGFDTMVRDKTAIYISHRLSSCRFCNDIAVFHQGQLIQRGSHEELLKDEKGKYYEMWHAQAQYYTTCQES